MELVLMRLNENVLYLEPEVFLLPLLKKCYNFPALRRKAPTVT